MDILSEDLDWRGGYERVLGALGAGTRRRSRIASRAQQRIDYTLGRLRQAGYVRAVRPHGSPAVQRRVRERWQAHLGRVFEEAAREHAVRLVESGEFPAEMTVGRWWRDKLATVGGADNPAQIDVLGLLDERTRLVGEARWQNHPLSLRDLQALRAKLCYLPEPHRDVEFALWSRGGGSPAVSRESSVRLFTCADMT